MSPGEVLTKDELQSGVDVANQIAEGYLKSMQTIPDGPEPRLGFNLSNVVCADHYNLPFMSMCFCVCSVKGSRTNQCRHQSRSRRRYSGGADEP